MLRVSAGLLGAGIKLGVVLAAAEATGRLSTQSLKQLVSLIRRFIHTGRSNHTDHLVD